MEVDKTKLEYFVATTCPHFQARRMSQRMREEQVRALPVGRVEQDGHLPVGLPPLEGHPPTWMHVRQVFRSDKSN